MARHFASNALTLLVIVVFAGAGVIAWGKAQFGAAGPLQSAICLRVGGASGPANMTEVAQILAGENAVSSEAIYRAGSQYLGRDSQLKAGSFLLRPGVSMAEINAIVTGSGRSTCGTEINYRIGILRSEVLVNELDPESNRYVERLRFNPAQDETPADYAALREDSSVRYRITMAEGITSWQIVDALKHADFLSGEISEVPDEGSLAPLANDVEPGTDRGALLARMGVAQREVLEAAWQNRAPGLPLESPEEALILASIIEKETGVSGERAQVSSVFINRLNQGIRLQTDPTVIYGITRGQGALGRGLRQSELRSDTPWNTYVIDGLPPTPIANPGAAAIEAALNPSDTDFLFFVADGSGGHAFARTLQEHNRNVDVWRRIEAERNSQSGN